MTRLLAILASLVVLLFAGCAEPLQPTLDVTPTALTLVAGQKVQLTVTRRFAGGAVEDVTNRVTYVSSNTLLATVTKDGSRGLVTAGVDAGSVLIRVTDTSSDATGVATFTVVAPAIQSIAITPSPARVMTKGESLKFTAVATLNTGVTRDVTTQVLWSSTDGTVASVGNTAADKGVVTALSKGDTTIIATDATSFVQGRTIVFVSGESPQLVAILVTPNPGIVQVAQTAQYNAQGVFSDGSTRDLTGAVRWSSSRTDLATIDTNGLVTGVAVGDTTITASAPDATSTVAGSAALKIAP
jgi:hypothetical protein